MQEAKHRVFTEHLFNALAVLLVLPYGPYEEKVIPIRLIAAQLGLSMSYVEKITRSLVDVGLIRTIRGTNGGLMLANARHEITVANVFNAIDIGPPQEELPEVLSRVQIFRQQLVRYNRKIMEEITLNDILTADLSSHSAFADKM